MPINPDAVGAKGQPTDLELVGTASFGELGGMPGASLVAVSGCVVIGRVPLDADPPRTPRPGRAGPR